jgi:hypothetical protein
VGLVEEPASDEERWECAEGSLRKSGYQSRRPEERSGGEETRSRGMARVVD